MRRLNVGNHPFPEGHRLRVWIVDAEDRDAFLDPEAHHIAQRKPQRRQRIAIEVDVDDVLIFLRRIFGKLDRAVRAPVEPLRMLLDPRMIRRALDGKVESDLEPVRARRRDQTCEIIEIAKLLVDCIVAAILGANRIGAAWIVRPCPQVVVAAFAVGFSDGVNRGEVEHVEALVSDIRKSRDHVVERAVAKRVARLRARHQLIPGRTCRDRPVDGDFERAIIAGEIGAQAVPPHQRGSLRALQNAKQHALVLDGLESPQQGL